MQLAGSTLPPRATTHRRPWPAFTLRYSHGLLLEVEGASLFLRTGSIETYLRRRAAYDPTRAFIREPGSVEVYGLGLGLTVSRKPARAGVAA